MRRETVDLPVTPQPIVIADYGLSQGHNSLGSLAVAISVLRERVGSERAISVVHTDLPRSDFTALFQTLAADPNKRTVVLYRSVSFSFGVSPTKVRKVPQKSL